MQHREGIRKLGLIGACLAFASSILMFAGPATASAHEIAAGSSRDNITFLVRLTGDQLRDGGDRHGQADAILDFRPRDGLVCYWISWERLRGAVTAFHLHNAPRYQDGGHWIDFFNDKYFDGAKSGGVGCVPASPYAIYEVLRYPSGFYLNLHTTAHEAGAVRGQLQ